MYQSGTARRLSGAVLFALLAIQLLFAIPSWVSRQGVALQQALEVENARLEAAARFTSVQAFEIPGTLLSETLIGIRFVDDSGSVLMSKGETEMDLPLGETVLMGHFQLASWPMKTLDGDVTALAIIDTSETRLSGITHAFGTLAVLLLASIAGALVALVGTAWMYIRPLDELVGELQASRANGRGDVPESIQFAGGEDLAPLADEFNSLIDAQRKAARQVKVKQQYLEFAAHHDPLTHLPNRLMFEDALKKTVRSAVKDELRFAVFLVDLDNFKFFNDQYGHLVGDKMVAEVGNRLRTMMRDIDLVARLDGDEFVVIQKDVRDRESAEEVARRLMSVATAPYEYRGFTLKAAVSVGISCFPQDVHSGQDEEMLGEEIVNNAAVALQEAKSNGKNQSQLFNESMRSRLTARIRLEQDLKAAVAEGQFELFYQPKVNIHTRQITGSEALIRWKHPSRGFISPEIFVPVAEEVGLIIELGEWILRTACRQTHELHSIGHDSLNVAVNISAVQFTDGNLLPMIAKVVAETRLPPERLELEITESAVMHDPEEVIHSLHELSRFGMRLAIDDFGTGYSSLSYLKRFPVDTLKIDRAFVTDVSSDNDDVAIIEAILGLGKHFNMNVVAEGIEDEEQLLFLRDSGCDLAQGFFISRPMNFNDYKLWIESWPYGIQGHDEPVRDNVVPLIAARK